MYDLHCHLDGSMRMSTLTELLQEKNYEIPDQIKFYPGMGLDEALSRFKTTLSVLQHPDAIERVTREICEDGADIGVGFTEIRFAPQLHHGAPIDEIVEAAISGLDDHANIILCGLYGESPQILNTLVEIARMKERVVGIDLAGGPLPSHRWSLLDYAEPFKKARKYGIGRTVHASEGRSPKEIEVAINFLHAQRIGHGTTLLQDRKTLDLVRQKGVTIEACITSNWHTGAIDKLSDHPIKKWVDEDVRVAICSDNTLLSETDLSSEYRKAVAHCGLTYRDIKNCRIHAAEALFRR